MATEYNSYRDFFKQTVEHFYRQLHIDFAEGSVLTVVLIPILEVWVLDELNTPSSFQKKGTA